MSGTVVLLGPQRPTPNAPAALTELRAEGPIVVIAAGWQQDEADEAVFREHLSPQAEVLPLYAWFEYVLRELPELRAAYRARQEALIRIKRLHRVRLNGALRVVHELHEQEIEPHARRMLEHAKDDVRRIDVELLAACGAVLEDHHGIGNGIDVVEQLRAKAAKKIRSAGVVVLAGGHVAVLRNRLAFFGVDDLLIERHRAGLPIVAWSAGAMLLTERIVLFYDDPQDGPAYPEILNRGLGIVPGVLLLPHARQRLRLEDRQRVALLTERFAPAVCLALENGAWLGRERDRWINRGVAFAANELQQDGTVVPLSPPMEER